MLSSSSKLSVIIPVYNGTNYLREAIESVLSQTYSNHEIIIVDDGSTDETWDLVQSYGSKVHGIHKENGGVASALNCGIQKATGEYIAWLSHDDLWLATKLERQLSFMRENPQFSASYTDYYVIDEQGRILQEIETPWYPRQRAIRELFCRQYIDGSTMLMERACFEQVGHFSEDLRYTQDAEMWLRMLNKFDIGRVPEKLGKQRTHPSRGSSNVHIHTLETQAMYSRMFAQLGVAGLFPERAENVNSPEVISETLIWLGDTMATHRGWLDYAEEQYLSAIAVHSDANKTVRNKLTSIKMRKNLLKAKNIIRPAYNSLRSFLATFPQDKS